MHACSLTDLVFIKTSSDMAGNGHLFSYDGVCACEKPQDLEKHYILKHYSLQYYDLIKVFNWDLIGFAVDMDYSLCPTFINTAQKFSEVIFDTFCFHRYLHLMGAIFKCDMDSVREMCVVRNVCDSIMDVHRFRNGTNAIENRYFVGFDNYDYIQENGEPWPFDNPFEDHGYFNSLIPMGMSTPRGWSTLISKINTWNDVITLLHHLEAFCEHYLESRVVQKVNRDLVYWNNMIVS